MRHLKSGRKLKRTASHRRALLNNLATSLLQHKRIQTTEAKAKELRPFVEQLITKAKRALVKEQAGALPNGQTVDVHARRVVGRVIRSKAVVQELFDAIAPVVENRPGGYVRIIKTGTRFGDGGRTAVIELVDWAEAQDGRASFGRKKKKKSTSTQRVEQVDTVQAQVVESIAATAAALEVASEEDVQEAIVDTAVQEEASSASDSATESTQNEPTQDGQSS